MLELDVTMYKTLVLVNLFLRTRRCLHYTISGLVEHAMQFDWWKKALLVIYTTLAKAMIGIFQAVDHP